MTNGRQIARPGAVKDLFAPYKQVDGPCAVCGKIDDCICPDCPECGARGAPRCYEQHGLVRSEYQIQSLAKRRNRLGRAGGQSWDVN
jgi:hypothetical protein